MLKKAMPLLTIILITIILSACSTTTKEPIEGTDEKVDATDFGRMLSLIPFSLLENYDIFYGNQEQARDIHGVADVDNLDELIKLTEEQRRKFAEAWSEAPGTVLSWINEDIAELIGFDGCSLDRVVTVNNIPPHISYVIEGRLNGELIAEKFTELDYIKNEYGSYTYYAMGGDFEIKLNHPLGRLALNKMNRLAIRDKTLIISPATADITGVFDVMDGKTDSIIDNPVSRALFASLGDPLTATITTPDRIIYNPASGGEPPRFDFTVPDSWGQIHHYEMAALGYRADGENRFLDIALFYTNTKDAQSDAPEIIKRMNSYTLYTWMEHVHVAFTDEFRPDEPSVIEYEGGAVLKIPCLLVPEGKKSINMLMGSGMAVRDLLFLIPIRKGYSSEKENPEITMIPSK